jgi:hypothetical protein
MYIRMANTCIPSVIRGIWITINTKASTQFLLKKEGSCITNDMLKTSLYLNQGDIMLGDISGTIEYLTKMNNFLYDRFLFLYKRIKQSH